MTLVDAQSKARLLLVLLGHGSLSVGLVVVIVDRVKCGDFEELWSRSGLGGLKGFGVAWHCG
jgi:hypothetical protein